MELKEASLVQVLYSLMNILIVMVHYPNEKTKGWFYHTNVRKQAGVTSGHNKIAC
jgi:hypothetical protein